ncbi:hypothetical protein M501DRAFT_994768 [Patellaria atrata CBS 101060]|uniref:Uncharacterized protein n=1 Tax=Patellaria atrata CBS 101060 TaxID=1346257 RepID=A0A9P4SJB6_9PEZI|nr:hypothetical protein M501DRAFT_994768 [Patellaria atrata CBS 101060]
MSADSQVSPLAFKGSLRGAKQLKQDVDDQNKLKNAELKISQLERHNQALKEKFDKAQTVIKDLGGSELSPVASPVGSPMSSYSIPSLRPMKKPDTSNPLYKTPPHPSSSWARANFPSMGSMLEDFSVSSPGNTSQSPTSTIQSHSAISHPSFRTAAQELLRNYTQNLAQLSQHSTQHYAGHHDRDSNTSDPFTDSHSPDPARVHASIQRAAAYIPPQSFSWRQKFEQQYRAFETWGAMFADNSITIEDNRFQAFIDTFTTTYMQGKRATVLGLMDSPLSCRGKIAAAVVNRVVFQRLWSDTIFDGLDSLKAKNLQNLRSKYQDAFSLGDQNDCQQCLMNMAEIFKCSPQWPNYHAWYTGLVTGVSTEIMQRVGYIIKDYNNAFSNLLTMIRASLNVVLEARSEDVDWKLDFGISEQLVDPMVHNIVIYNNPGPGPKEIQLCISPLVTSFEHSLELDSGTTVYKARIIACPQKSRLT